MYLDLDLDKFPKEMLIDIIEHQQDLLFNKHSDDLDVTMLRKQIKGLFGGQRKLAHLLGISQPQISRWCRGHEKIPEHRKKQITGLSGGQINFNLLIKKNNMMEVDNDK